MSDQQGWTVPGAMPRPQGSAYPPPGPAGLPTPGAALPQAAAPVAPVAPAGYQPPGWAPPQLAPKPGIIPLRPLTLGEIWSGVMTAVPGNPTATIGLALVTQQSATAATSRGWPATAGCATRSCVARTELLTLAVGLGRPASPQRRVRTTSTSRPGWSVVPCMSMIERDRSAAPGLTTTDCRPPSSVRW